MGSSASPASFMPLSQRARKWSQRARSTHLRAASCVSDSCVQFYQNYKRFLASAGHWATQGKLILYSGAARLERLCAGVYNL